jgi:ADP-heptose:LPS heptosyltransferase
MRPNFNRILVIRSSGALGDIVLSMPVIDALRGAYPESYIEVAGSPSLIGIADPVADSIVPLPEGFWTLFSGNGEVPSGLGRHLGSFDLIVFFASPGEPSPSGGVHVCDWYLAALEPLCVRGSGIPRVGVTAEADGEADALWGEYGLADYPGVIGYAPGSGSPSKNWPEDMFVKALRILGVEIPSGVIEILGPAESGEGPPSVEPRRNGGMIVRNLPLPVLAGLLRRCSAYVGNDSGVTHLAAASGAPTVALFGPTDPSVWGPRGDRVAVVTSAAECAPCTREERRSCGERRCMKSIELSEVVALVRTLRTAAMCEALAQQ